MLGRTTCSECAMVGEKENSYDLCRNIFCECNFSSECQYYCELVCIPDSILTQQAAFSPVDVRMNHVNVVLGLSYVDKLCVS